MRPLLGAWMRWVWATARLWFSDRAAFWQQIARLATARRAHVQINAMRVERAEWDAASWYHPTLEMLVADEWLLYDVAAKVQAEGKSLYLLAATDTVYVLPAGTTGDSRVDGGQFYGGALSEEAQTQALEAFARSEARRVGDLTEVYAALGDLSVGRRLRGD